MTDPLRSDRPAASADPQERERDARVEDLLLAGLDHYFAGQHERAISVWTRVLFLNHGHARARAYIVRARSAISERQRENEELVHSGVEALSRGNAPDARRLLTAALERGVANDDALSLLDRLDRFESTAASQGAGLVRLDHRGGSHLAPTGLADNLRPSPVRWVGAGLAAGAVIAIAAAALWLEPQSRRSAPAAPALSSTRRPCAGGVVPSVTAVRVYSREKAGCTRRCDARRAAHGTAAWG